jgi:hypothetical protein
LDQLLEHLIKAGIAQIIRIGGQSKSALLALANLREVSRRSFGFTKAESSRYGELKGQMEAAEDELSSQIKIIGDAASWESGRNYLQIHNSRHLESFGGIDSEGFTVVSHRKCNPLTAWLQGGDDVVGSRTGNLSDVDDIFKLNRMQRFGLFNSWVAAIKHPVVQAYENVMQELLGLQKKMSELKNEKTLRCLQEANIIGLTSSGLARNIPLLKPLNPKVVVMEEAGELLEAHSITSFLPSV